MPSVSQNQQKFMGIELSRKRKGLSTRTNMTEDQLEDYASTKHKDLPKKVDNKKKKKFLRR